MPKSFHRAIEAIGVMLAIALMSGHAATYAAGYELRGKVVYVDDGDTVVLLSAGNVQEKIRLSSIDAPETAHTSHETGRLGQPFSDRSRVYLAGLVKGKSVTARCAERDQYGRNVCDILVEGISANREMVAAGMAWANRAAHGRYLRDPEVLRLEQQARARRMGLWADSRPVEPWLWRTECWKRNTCPGAQ